MQEKMPQASQRKRKEASILNVLRAPLRRIPGAATEERTGEDGFCPLRNGWDGAAADSIARHSPLQIGMESGYAAAVQGRMGPSMAYWYRVYGLTVQSDLVCPELPDMESRGRGDIAITVASTVEPAGDGKAAHFARIAGVADFRVEQGGRIVVCPAPQAAPADIRQYLYGVALTAALYQRGESPIHAGAVAFGGRAHLFCGPSGAGKSTLIMQLRRLGRDVLCDDVGVIRQGKDNIVRFYPGVPRLKLWQDALAQFAIDSRGLHRDLVRYDKYHLPLGDGMAEGLPLGSVFRLITGAETGSPEISPVSGVQILDTLLRNTYRPRLLKRLGDPRGHAARCIAAARQAAGFDFRRPWNLGRLGEGGDALVAHLTAMTTTGVEE